MNKAEMKQIAWVNIENHIGDCFEATDNPDESVIHDAAFTLGHDALVDAGVDTLEAAIVAAEVAAPFNHQ